MSAVLDLIRAGGPWMWPLVVLGVALWAGLIFRLLSLRRQRYLAVPELLALAQAQWRGAQPTVPPGMGDQGELLAALSPPDTARERLMAKASELHSAWNLGHSMLRRAVEVAPLLGLLGTVHGMINIFLVFHGGSGDQATQLANGIGQALLTTQMGLLIAVPGMVVLGRLERWEDRLRHRLEESRLALQGWLARQTPGEVAP